MDRKVIILVTLLAAVAGYSPAIMASDDADFGTTYSRWYVGAGIDFTTVTSDEKVYVDGEEWAGFSAIGGHRFNDLIYLEFMFKGAMATDLSSQVIAVGPRLNILKPRDRVFVPWVAAYLSAVELDWDEDSVHMDSLTICGSGGFDLRISDNGFIQTAARYYSFTSDLEQFSTVITGDADTQIYEITVQYVHNL